MNTRDLSDVLRGHPFLEGLPQPVVDVLVGCARNRRYAEDAHLFEAGQPADTFYLIRAGRVAIEVPHHGQRPVVKTVEAGAVLGWSWLVPPHTWHFSARATCLTRALALDGVCLRRKCEADPSLGYTVLKRLAHNMQDELDHAWMQLADIYAPR